MQLFLKISLLISVTILLNACGNEPQEDDETKTRTNETNTATPQEYKRVRIIEGKSVSQYVGKPGRLMIVSKNGLYTKEVAHLFDSIFGKEVRPYYPRHPYFEIFHRTPSEFEEKSRRLRNVVELNVSENVEKGKPRMEIYKNHFAETQLYTKVYAHDINEFYTFLQDELPSLFRLYDTQEWKREYYRHRKSKQKITNDKLEKKFGIRLQLPKKMRYESIDEQYAIILLPDRSRQMEMKTTGTYSSTKANFVQSGIMIWQYPFKDSSQLTPAKLMEERDSILKYHAKHEVPGVYMGTQDHPAVIPEYEKFRVNGIEGYQFRGLYKFTGRIEPSGGKFWSFHFKHPKRNTIVAISGYLDAPPTMSISFDINRIRAIIYSLRTTD